MRQFILRGRDEDMKEVLDDLDLEPIVEGDDGHIGIAVDESAVDDLKTSCASWSVTCEEA